MTRDALLNRISTDPIVCSGKPGVRGTRVWESLIMDLLVSDASTPARLSNHRGLTADDVLACIAYGAEMPRER